MKKVVFVLLLCIAFIILLSSCGSSNVIYQTPASINKFYASDTDANLTIFQYTWDGWGIKAKK